MAFSGKSRFIFFPESLCLRNTCIAERALYILTNHMRKKPQKMHCLTLLALTPPYAKMKIDFNLD